MVSYDGIWETRIFYNSGTSATNQLPHVQKFDVNVTNDPAPGAPFEEISLQTRGGATTDMQLFIENDYMPLLRDCFDTFTDFVRVELWKIPEGTFDATFISSFELALTGTLGSGNVLSQQTTFTFRSLGGGTGRIQLMESGFGGSLKQTPPYASSEANDLTSYVIGTTSPILARDNTPFISRIHQCDGQNEVIWRKRNRL